MRLASLPFLLDTVGPTLRRGRAHRHADPSRRIALMDLGEALVRYRRAGPAHRPCLVLSADPPAVLESYDRLLSLLSDELQVVVFEAPGFGHSLPRSGFEFSMADFNRVTERFLERLDAGPYILGLPCMFGFVAIQLANRRPDLVSRTIMIQQPSWEGAMKWRARCDPSRLFRRSIVGQLALHMLKQKSVAEWFSAVVAEQDDAARLIADAHRVVRDGGCFCLASIFQSYLGTEPALRPVEQPTLVIWGQRDRSHGRQEHTRAPSLVCGPVHTHVFPSQGHYPELEAPDRFAGLVRDFVARTA